MAAIAASSPDRYLHRDGAINNNSASLAGLGPGFEEDFEGFALKTFQPRDQLRDHRRYLLSHFTAWFTIGFASLAEASYYLLGLG